MADFPLACNIQGDYGYKVVVVDDGDTISEVVRKATDQIVGVLVAPFPQGTKLRARVHEPERLLADDVVVKDAELVQMEAIDIVADAAP